MSTYIRAELQNTPSRTSKIDLKGEVDKFIIIVGDKTVLSEIERTRQQKVRKNIKVLNKTIT